MEEIDPVYGYAAFATNVARGVTPAWTQVAYSARWGVENGYKDANRVRPRTMSNDPSVRMFMLFISLLAYNLWVRERAECDGALRLSAFEKMLMRGASECVVSGVRDPGGGASDPG